MGGGAAAERIGGELLMADYLTTDTELTSIANAIRTKGGTSANLTYPAGFVSAIENIPTGSDPTIQSLTVTPTTSQQTFNSSSVDGYKPVTVSAMPSGTAGTPTATKGTVSNHSVDVTPSVTNTTGYITGSTKTGTAVTVAASELVSGSETKTQNGTYDVTNLAQLIVNVAGGGGSGLVYESGTYTPTADIARPTISFSNTHSTEPILVLMSDISAASSTTANSNTVFGFLNVSQATGGTGYPYSTSSTRPGVACYIYRNTNSSASSLTMVQYSGAGTTTAYTGYWVTSSNFMPYSNSTSRYWRANRNYKWIAVWGPTT